MSHREFPVSAAITAEHFELTPGIRETIEDSVAPLTALVRRPTIVSVFLKREAKRGFTAIIRIPVKGNRLVAREDSEDLPSAIMGAAETLRRMMIARKERSLHLRRHVDQAWPAAC